MLYQVEKGICVVGTEWSTVAVKQFFDETSQNTLHSCADWRNKTALVTFQIVASDALYTGTEMQQGQMD